MLCNLRNFVDVSDTALEDYTTLATQAGKSELAGQVCLSMSDC